MGDGTGDEVIEAREVVRGRRQRKARPARNGAVTDRLESAFTQQLGGGAYQRVPPTFSLGSNSSFESDSCLRSNSWLGSDNSLGSGGYLGSDSSPGSHSCSHLRHAASQAGAALPFRINTPQPRSGERATRRFASSGTL